MKKNVFISNKILTVLFIAAFVVVALGSLVNTENYLGAVFIKNILTGAAQSDPTTGEVNITITASTSLTNRVASISFGSGRVNSTCDYCIMDSNFINLSYFSSGTKSAGRLPFHGAAEAGASCCVSFSGNQSGFLLENTGNTNVSVGYQCARNCTFDSFIGGTRQAAMAGLEIKVTPNLVAQQSGESGATDTLFSCQGGGYYKWNGWNISNASDWGLPVSSGGDGNRSGAGVGNSSVEVDGGNFYIMLGGVHYQSPNNVSAGGHWLCGNRTHYPLSSVNTQDAAVIDINVTIPSDATPLGKPSSLLITFNATSST